MQAVVAPAFPEVELRLRSAAWRGFLARRSAEDLEPFRMLESALRDAVLRRSGGSPD